MSYFYQIMLADEETAPITPGGIWLFKIDDQQVTSLNVSNSEFLAQLMCDRNELTSLDVSNNLKLYILNCSFNSLTTLDLSQNVKLEVLLTARNQLASLNLLNNVKIAQINASGNPFASNLTEATNFANSMPTVTPSAFYIVYFDSADTQYNLIEQSLTTKGWRVEADTGTN